MLNALNAWMEAQGLPRGLLTYDFADAATGEQKAVFDLAWPNGIQEELSQPVAVLEVECRSAGAARCRFLVANPEFLEQVYDEMSKGTRYDEAIAAATSPVS